MIAFFQWRPQPTGRESDSSRGVLQGARRHSVRQIPAQLTRTQIKHVEAAFI